MSPGPYPLRKKWLYIRTNGRTHGHTNGQVDFERTKVHSASRNKSCMAHCEWMVVIELFGWCAFWRRIFSLETEIYSRRVHSRSSWVGYYYVSNYLLCSTKKIVCQHFRENIFQGLYITFLSYHSRKQSNNLYSLFEIQNQFDSSCSSIYITCWFFSLNCN